MSDERLRERQTASELIFDGRILHLYRDDIELPNGKPADRELIRHVGAVCVIPVTDDGCAVMERQYRYPVDEVVLEIPAGKLEKGEDPFFAAVRELEEETGFKTDSIIKLGEYWPTVGYCSERVYLYFAKMLSKGSTHFDDDEFISLIKMPFEKAYEMCMNGEICDGKTQLAILKAKHYL